MKCTSSDIPKSIMVDARDGLKRMDHFRHALFICSTFKASTPVTAKQDTWQDWSDPVWHLCHEFFASGNTRNWPGLRWSRGDTGSLVSSLFS